MALPAQKFREIVFQILYSSDMTGTDEEAMIPFMMGELKVTKRAMCDAYLKMHAVLSKRETIDPLIKAASKEYEFDRISRVEKNILRLGIYEMLFDESIPEKVAMAEAIRLTRKFGTPESAQFVNAIMDVIYRNNSEQSGIRCERRSDFTTDVVGHEAACSDQLNDVCVLENDGCSELETDFSGDCDINYEHRIQPVSK